MLGSRMWTAVGSVICGACLLCAACGGHAGLSNRGTGGATPNASGGETTLATTGTGGSAPLTSGGTGLLTSGTGGRTTVATGGTTVAGSSGGGASGKDGSPDTLSCAGVSCPSLPVSCKKIVQDPNACCPVCTDTGCDPCPEVSCAPGTHAETPAGACCPSCIADPPDPCTQGRQSYAALRAQLLEKYGSTKCKNSLECTLLLESNACGVFCNVALPTTMISNYQTNLAFSAATNCTSCPAAAPAQCERMVPACVNEHCAAANPS